AFVPIFLAYSALLIDPQMVGPLAAGDANQSQLILPKLILGHTPIFAQVMFFGALVSACAPLVLGLFWKRATTAGALLSVVLGLVTWLLLEAVAPEALVPPQLVGLAASFLGMVVGSLAVRPAHAQPHHGEGVRGSPLARLALLGH